MSGASSERIYRPSDEAEARLVESLLHDRDIDCKVISHRDTAYPGIGNRGIGWGEIRVEPRDAERARAAIAEWQQADSEDLDEAAMKAPREAEPQVAPGGRGALLLLLVLGVLLVLAALRVGGE